MREFLKGKKTYMTAIAAIVAVAIGWIEGGVSDLEAVQSIVAALFAVFIRSGVHSDIEKIERGL